MHLIIYLLRIILQIVFEKTEISIANFPILNNTIVCLKKIFYKLMGYIDIAENNFNFF